MIGSHTGTPKSYLSQFARIQCQVDRKPKLWVYQRGVSPRTSTPYRIGKENGYFALTLPDGSQDESLETILADFEGKAAELIRLVTKETYVLSLRDKETLTQYVALMFARTTARRGLSGKISAYIRNAYKELSTDPAWLQRQALLYERITGKPTSCEQISQATSRVLEKMARPQHVKNGFVQGLLQLAGGIFGELADKPWQIWESPESIQFITTDNPVITLKADTWGSFMPGWGLRTPGLITVFPISPKCCLIIGATGRYWRRATPRDVNGMNKGLVLCMDRWAYSAARSEDIEWLVNQTGGSLRYGENIFVPAWMNNASEHIKAKVAHATEHPVPGPIVKPPLSSGFGSH